MSTPESTQAWPIGHRQPYARVDSIPQSGTLDLASVFSWASSCKNGVGIDLGIVIEQPGGTIHWATLHTDTYKLYAHPLGADVDILLLLRLYKLVAGSNI